MGLNKDRAQEEPKGPHDRRHDCLNSALGCSSRIWILQPDQIHDSRLISELYDDILILWLGTRLFARDDTLTAKFRKSNKLSCFQKSIALSQLKTHRTFQATMSDSKFTGTC